jgi:hypothetical protein
MVTLLFYQCLCLLFNKIRDKGRRGSAWKGRRLGGRERVLGAGGEMAQTMNAQVNK